MRKDVTAGLCYSLSLSMLSFLFEPDLILPCFSRWVQTDGGDFNRKVRLFLPLLSHDLPLLTELPFLLLDQRKVLNKQKDGKARLKKMAGTFSSASLSFLLFPDAFADQIWFYGGYLLAGNVEIPQEAFFDILSSPSSSKKS